MDALDLRYDCEDVGRKGKKGRADLALVFEYDSRPSVRNKELVSKRLLTLKSLFVSDLTEILAFPGLAS